jgi:hypothetical protein
MSQRGKQVTLGEKIGVSPAEKVSGEIRDKIFLHRADLHEGVFVSSPALQGVLVRG